MDISLKSLNIGYKFSTHTARDPHHALSTPAHWLDLIHKASIENEDLNSKGKNRKRFKVHVKSFHAAAKPKSEKGGTKTGKSKGKGTKQARESEEESSKGDEEGKKGDETDWVAQIQARKNVASTRASTALLTRLGCIGSCLSRISAFGVSWS